MVRRRWEDVTSLETEEGRKEAVTNLVSDEAARLGMSKDELLEKYAEEQGLPPEEVSPEEVIGTIVTSIYEKGVIPTWSVTAAGTITTGTRPIPTQLSPRIMIVETYALTSFLGDYGVGRTLRIFTLLPNEKTKISIKTWKTRETTEKEARSVLDSWSKDTSDSFEESVQSETTSKEELTKNTDFNFETTGEGHFNVGIWGVGGTHEVGYKEAWTDSRENFAKNVSNATSKHVANVSSKRNVEVNTSFEAKDVVGEETSIVRELENVNAGRVLNFVFRQLNQEYITYLHLVDVKLAFTDGLSKGSSNNYRELPLSEIEDLLGFCLKDQGQDESGNPVNPRSEVRRLIVERLKNVYDYRGVAKQFIECVDLATGQTRADVMDYVQDNLREDTNGRLKLYLRVKRTPFYQNSNRRGPNYEQHLVEGVILAKDTYILPTDSVICEALLGQAEALDKYSQDSRQAVIDMKRAEIEKMNLANRIIESGDEEKAELFAKIYPPLKEEKRIEPPVP